ncbi:MAG: amidohydrolase family protein, partial [Rhodospirillales bacterium]|nr:amidohydrolase family protein [Rhodospirillales bacterium]
MATYDLILRNGTLVDGGGGPRRAADVAIKGDRIAAIGAPGTLRGDNEIDAADRIVAPGFIDVHTHDDTALIGNPGMAMKASQGVTSVVCGNCGFSAAPYLGPRPVPHNLSLIVKEERFLAETFGAFAGMVEEARPAINGAFLIGHATLR